MGALNKFFSQTNENNVFKFTIDTRNIVSGATNGSENPLSFKIPSIVPNTGNLCVVRVSDGRPDLNINGTSTTSNFILNFTTAGIYDITIIGRLSAFSFYAADGYDKLKMIKITQWGNFKFGIRTFSGCSNLVIDAPDVFNAPADFASGFSQVKEIISNLNLVDTTKTTASDLVFSGLQTPLKSLLNPFWKSLVLFQVYQNVVFDNSITKIQIISDSITQLFSPFTNITTTATLELDVQTPNLVSVNRLLWTGAVKARSHAGKVDVRSVTTTTDWLGSALTTSQVDATLLGWANNLPYMQAGVTWNWLGSKYSNTPTVIAAYNKITSTWGVIFTNLTML